MLYVYVINILYIRLSVRFSVYFGYISYRNIGTIRVFESFGPVPVSGISIRFWFGSSVPVFCLGLTIIIKIRPFIFHFRGDLSLSSSPMYISIFSFNI